MFHKPTIPIFLDLKATVDSADRAILRQILLSMRVSEKLSSFIQSMYVNSRSQVRVYGHLSFGFTAESGIRHDRPLLAFLFTFFTDFPIELALSSCKDSGIDIFSSRKL